MHRRAANAATVALAAISLVSALPLRAAPPGPGPFAYHVTLSPATLTVAAGASATLTVSIDKPTPDILPIAVTTTGPAGLVDCPGHVRIQAGRTAAKFQVKGLVPGGPVTVTATLPATAGGTSASAQVTVRGLSISLSPATLEVVKGTTGTLTVTISAPAPVGGVNVYFTQTGPTGIVSVQAGLTLSPGTTTGQIFVGGLEVGGPVTIRASLHSSLGGASDSSKVSVVLHGKTPFHRR